MIQAFQFRTGRLPLFGCYHGLDSPSQRAAILLCHPFGEEYMRTHRAIRQLAVRLARSGFAVLRFDFSGCGDSGGEEQDGHLDQWQADVLAAIEELRGRADVERVCLVGLRLGATLAALAGSQCGGVDGLVLWDPIVNGSTYLRELSALHRRRIHTWCYRSGDGSPRSRPSEALGFPLCDQLLDQLAETELTSLGSKPADTVLVLASRGFRRAGRLATHLQSVSACVSYRRQRGSAFWIQQGDQPLVPLPMLQTIVSWISESVS